MGWLGDALNEGAYRALQEECVRAGRTPPSREGIQHAADRHGRSFSQAVFVLMSYLPVPDEEDL